MTRKLILDHLDNLEKAEELKRIKTHLVSIYTIHTIYNRLSTIKLTTVTTILNINMGTNISSYALVNICLAGLPSHSSRPSVGDCHLSPQLCRPHCSPVSQKINFLKKYQRYIYEKLPDYGKHVHIYTSQL